MKDDLSRLRKSNRSVLKLALLLFYTCLSFVPAFTYYNIKSFTYSVEQGLPTNLTKSILQDKEGFIWIATDNGLVQFDGKHFTTYQEGLPSPYVKALYQMRDGKILIATDRGICILRRQANQATFELFIPGSDPGTDSTVFYPKKLFEDSKGNLWISEPEAIVRYRDGKLQRYRFEEKFWSNSYLRSFLFLEDARGRLIASSQRGFLFIYDEKIDSFKQIPIRNPYGSFTINAMIELPDRRIFVGGDAGIFELRIDKGLTGLSWKRRYNFSGVQSFEIDSLGNLYLGTTGTGLYKIYLSRDRVCIRNFSMLSFNLINDIEVARDGTIWVCSDEGIGLLYKTFFTEFYKFYNYSIQNVVKARDGTIFVTDGMSIFKVLKEGHAFTREKVFAKLLRSNESFISSLAGDGNSLWIGHIDGTIAYLDGHRSRMLKLPERRTIFYTMLDRNHNLWVCQNGVDYVLKIDSNFHMTRYGSRKGIFSSLNVIKEGGDGTIYGGGNGNHAYLYRYDPGLDRFINISVPLPEDTHFGIQINDLDIDKKENVWLASNDGLWLFRRDSMKKALTSQNFPVSVVKSVAIDSFDNVWFGTNRGLFRYANHQLTLFDRKDGLPDMTLAFRSAIIGNEQRIWVGTYRGVAYGKILSSIQKPTPKPILLSILINGSEIPYREADEIPRLPDASFLELNFVSLSYPGEKIVYQSRLLGWQKEWSVPSRKSQIIIPKLPQGTYVLQVRAQQTGHLWSDCFYYKFVVLPPWYRTLEAYLTYAILLSLLFLVTFKMLMAIRQRRLAERSLRDREEQDRLIFENAPIGIVTANLDGRLRSVNPAFCEIFGYTAEELMQKTIKDLTYPEDVEESLRKLQELVKGSISRIHFEKRYVRKDGTIIHAIVRAALLRDEAGRPFQFVGEIEDITDRKRSEEEMRLLQTITQAISECLDFYSALEVALKKVCEATRWCFAEAWIPDDGGTVLMPGPVWCRDSRNLENFRKKSKLFRFPPGVGLAGRVWVNKRSEWIPNISDALNSHCPRAHDAQEAGLKATLGVPILARDQVLAVLVFFMYEFHQEEAQWVNMISAVASQLGSILQRVRVESELRVSEEKHRTLIETMMEGLTIVDENENLKFVNQAVCDMLGYRREELLRMNLRDLIPEEDFLQVKRQTVQREHGKQSIYETQMRTKDGRHRTVMVAAAPRFDAGGKFLETVGVIHDITERKQAEEALRESEERYRRFFEEDLTGDYISTPDGRLIACNPAFVRIFGFQSKEEALKCNLDSLYPNPRSREALLELLKEKKKLEYYELELIRRDGRPVYVIANIRGIFDEKGELETIKGYLFDNTERKILERQLLQSQKMEAIGRLAGGVAHDFNNLLTVIQGYCELLLKRIGLDDPIRKDLEQIKKAGDRASGLTNQLLAFSRRQILQPKLIDLNKVVVEIERMLRRLIGEDIELVTILDPALGKVKADPVQIEQVIMNLAVNARDAMPMGGKLTIETANVELDKDYSKHHVNVKPGPYVMLAVGDTGLGIDVETQSHIFEPFFTTKERGKGTGLGLSTVYGIIKQSDGYIWVYSELGQGTVFKIYLPRIGEAVQLEEPIPLTVDSLRGSETILLVEDEDMVRDLARRILQENGYRVLVASRGEFALRICEQHEGPIHLLLTDVVMPRMSGRELVRRMAPSRPEMKVLYISGYTEDAIVHHGVLDPGVAFLQKPFTRFGLLRRVRKILDGNEATKK